MTQKTRKAAGLTRSALAFAITASLLASPLHASAITRDEVMKRAKTWTDKRVPYSQARYKDGFRTDCSGYVSMAWGLDESLTTWSIPQVSKRIGKSDLKPGDILLNNDGGALRHAVLFGGWANKERTAYIGYEQNGPAGRAIRRVIPYPFFFAKNKFKPWRFKDITDSRVIPLAPPAPPVPVNEYVDTLRGADHYLTAVRTSKRAFEKADTVVVASGEMWADALVASSLAGASDAPLLLVGKKKVHGEVLAEIKRLGAREILMVGSGSAIGPESVNALKRLAPVRRFAGSNRYETASIVARETIRRLEADPSKDYDGKTLIVPASRPADAVAATPLVTKKGWPLLFADRAQLPAFTKWTMRFAGITGAVILGDSKVIQSNVAREIEETTGSRISRIGGGDPYAASVSVAEFAKAEAGLKMKNAAIVTNASHIDSVAAGVAQGASGSVMLLTRTDQLSTPVSRTLNNHAEEIGKIRVIGGTMEGPVKETIAQKLDAVASE